MNQEQDFLDEYKKVDLIDKGTFGEAWKVKSKQTRKIFIMKEINSG